MGATNASFFPERYHHGGHVLVPDLPTRHSETTTVKNKATEQYYMTWWMNRLEGERLNQCDGRCD